MTQTSIQQIIQAHHDRLKSQDMIYVNDIILHLGVDVRGLTPEEIDRLVRNQRGQTKL